MNDTFECVGFIPKITLRVRHLNQKKILIESTCFCRPETMVS